MSFNKFCVGGIVLGMSALSSATYVIDNFTTAQPILQLTTVSSIYSQANGGSIAGGQRDSSLQLIDNPFAITNGLKAWINGNGLNIVSADPGVLGALSLDYDSTGDPAGDPTTVEGIGLNANLTAENALRIGYSFADLPVNGTITMYHYGDAASTAAFTLPTQNVTGSYFTDISFASFSGTPNLGAIDRIKITFDPGTSGDFVLTSFAAVPEPATLAVFAIGGLALIRRRRSR